MNFLKQDITFRFLVKKLEREPVFVLFRNKARVFLVCIVTHSNVNQGDDAFETETKHNFYTISIPIILLLKIS